MSTDSRQTHPHEFVTKYPKLPASRVYQMARALMAGAYVYLTSEP